MSVAVRDRELAVGHSVHRSYVRRSSVAWKEGLLLEKVLGYWRGSRVYVVCVTAASEGTVLYGVLFRWFYGAVRLPAQYR
jgi:hypothetical protein